MVASRSAPARQPALAEPQGQQTQTRFRVSIEAPLQGSEFDRCPAGGTGLLSLLLDAYSAAAVVFSIIVSPHACACRPCHACDAPCWLARQAAVPM